MSFIKVYNSNMLEVHANNVREYAYLMGTSLNMDKSELNKLILAAYLHDVGKNYIPQHILEKKGQLTDEEYNAIKKHPIIGAKIAQKWRLDKSIIEAIKYHHEKYDGTGYIEGLKGEEIPLFSRIISIADTYDVITSERPYKGAYSHTYAIGELRRCSGTQFDPNIIRVFEKNYLVKNA